jgi:uncharacterized damage-inducible protein DinB
MSDLRFPIGPFRYDPHPPPELRRQCIARIAAAPAAFRAAVTGLDDRQLDTPYRPGGWTVRQVVHHVPDSHMNAYIRFKLALTEDNPTIKTYQEDLWAGVADTAKTPIGVSLTLLEALHTRWGAVLESMADEDFERPLQHPELGAITLDRLLQLYAWHGAHHTAHVTTLKTREGW